MKQDIKFVSSENFSVEIEKAISQLDKIQTSGFFERVSGEKIYYEIYERDSAKAWIAISHGFTECTLKYKELIWYFVQAGYNVAICDHRGHGKSFRRVKEFWITNVNKFDDYSDDYAYFVDNIIKPKLNGKPLYLYGHSMGGAIAAHLVERFPNLPIEKVILNAPMISPQAGGLPLWIAKLIADIQVFLGNGHKNVFVQSAFDPEAKKQEAETGTDYSNSVSRNKWYVAKILKEKCYHNTAASYQWLKQSIEQTKKLLKADNCAKIKQPLLLIQAGKDTLVDNVKQNEFISKVKNARKIVFENAKHEIYFAETKAMKKYMDTIIDFLEEET